MSIFKFLVLTLLLNSFYFQKADSSIFDVIKLPGQPVKKAINFVHKQVNNTVRVIKNSIKLNCLGIPVNLFETIVKVLFPNKAKKNVRFYFSSRKLPNYATVQIVNGSLNFETQVDFDPIRKTFVLVHGFLSNGKEKWLEDMKNAFLNFSDVNVIVVDWQEGSNTWNYLKAASNVRIVGAEIAELLHKLKEMFIRSRTGDYNFELDRIHLVGHSLGSHIMAFASQKFTELQRHDMRDWLVERITALDPAQPCFRDFTDPILRLTIDDAPFIDVIHTNARQILHLGLGLPEQLGHMDFYPNGGQVMIGCSDINVKIWSFLKLPVNIIKQTICSHGRSHEYFLDSLKNAVTNKCNFVGIPWNRTYDNLDNLLQPNCHRENCAEMGINAERSYMGKEDTFFVATSSSKPYCEIHNQDMTEVKARLEKDKKNQH